MMMHWKYNKKGVFFLHKMIVYFKRSRRVGLLITELYIVYVVFNINNKVIFLFKTQYVDVSKTQEIVVF